jgi:hypothetical protein
MFDLATAKARLNIVGMLQDTELQAALAASLAVAEAYCKRRFNYAEETESVYHDSKGYLFLERYPIDHVTAVDAEGHTSVKYKTNKTAGYLDLHGRYSFEEVNVKYGGGYVTLPDDLLVALWSIFDGIWKAHFTSGSGTAPGGAIESVSLTGVGTVRFGKDGSGGATGAPMAAAIPSIASAILSNYKRYLA